MRQAYGFAHDPARGNAQSPRFFISRFFIVKCRGVMQTVRAKVTMSRCKTTRRNTTRPAKRSGG